MRKRNATSLAAPEGNQSLLLFTGNCGNEPFGSRSEPCIRKPTAFTQAFPGEIPEGRAELFLSLCTYARQRTLEPVLETGVTKKN